MLWPPSWTSQVIDSPELIVTSLGEKESFLTTTVAGAAEAGAATASAAAAARAKGSVRLPGARCWDIGGDLSDQRETTGLGSARCRHFPLRAMRALGYPSSRGRGPSDAQRSSSSRSRDGPRDRATRTPTRAPSSARG